jgi:3-keto-5-aminohexanoate cleavage enzyme
VEPLMIEVALNEQVDREVNPHVPYSVDEVVQNAVACAAAGAQIVHFHARDGVTGAQRWQDTDFYAEAFQRIRDECDVILYPSQPGIGVGACRHVFDLADDPEVGLELNTVDIMPIRLRPVLDERGILVSPWDPGPSDPMIEVMTELRRRGVAYSLGVREVGDMRYLSSYRDLGLLGDEVTVKIFFDETPHGPAPDTRGLLMYLDSVPAGMTCRWFVTLYGGRPGGGTFQRLSMLAAAMGGHIRTGLGDNPRLAMGTASRNADQVGMAAALARAAGRELATLAEARAMLGIRSPSTIGSADLRPTGTVTADAEPRQDSL